MAKFSGPINEMANIISELQSACAAAERVFRLIDEEPEPADVPGAFVLPETAGAGTVITLISSNGTVEYTIDCIPNNISNKVIWSGEWACGNWGGNQDLAWGGYDWNSVDLSAGTVTLVVELEQDASATYWQFMLKTGTSWNDLAGFSQIDMTAGQTVIEIPLSQEMLSDLQAIQAGIE